MFPRIIAVNGNASGFSPMCRQKQHVIQSNSKQKKWSRATVTNALNSARIQRTQTLVAFYYFFSLVWMRQHSHVVLHEGQK